MLSWKKYGNVFDPTRLRPRPWMQAYAQCPTPLVLDDEIVRVYVTTRGERDRDGQFVSYPGYVDLDRRDLTRIVRVAEQPVIPFGPPGSFDEFGVTPSSVVRSGGAVYAYYTGWTRLRSVPYTMAIGMAISSDGGATFEKLAPGPLLGPQLDEPFLLSGPIVRRIEDHWHMWYVSGRKWMLHEERYEPVYQIAHALSEDGVDWRRQRRPVIRPESEDECQISLAPFVVRGRWHALFAFRRPMDFRGAGSGRYRLGYASSTDLKHWERDDVQAGIAGTPGDWDGTMMCYPQVFSIDGRTLLFYCGNDFGRTGFGIAELTSIDGA